MDFGDLPPVFTGDNLRVPFRRHTMALKRLNTGKGLCGMDIHVVRAGETLNDIAQRYGVSTERLAQDNGLADPTRLVPGQTLVVLYPRRVVTVQPWRASPRGRGSRSISCCATITAWAGT